MGVNRAPLKEALKELAAEGFVKINPNQGVVISNAQVKDIQEVLQIRGVLEGLTAGLTAEVTNEEEIGKLKKYQKQMVHYTKKDDVLAFSEMDTEFYELILNICGKN